MSKGKAWRRTTILVDFLLVFAFASALILPLYKYKYLDKWASIESTFISDARFLKENWPHPRWQPLWYGGTRFDYVYPPALRYGTAVLAKYYPRMTEARAYHLYIAFFYSLGIAAVYLLVRLMSHSRGAAFLAAIGAALTSPSFLFIADMRGDSWLWHPQRLGALVRYGEGPHISALACIPLALAAAWLALEEFRPAWLAAAALMCALVVSNNFYGATALAIFFSVLTWSVWITRGDHAVWLRAAAIAALAYGLTAFWLVPSYIRITTENLKLVAQPGNNWSRVLALVVIAAYLAATARWARGRIDRQYRVFVAGIFLLFALNVLGHYYFSFRVTGEPLRHVPELDMVLIIALAECMRLLWLRTSMRIVWRTAAALIVIASLSTSYRYVRQAWAIIVRDDEVKSRVEYRMPAWMSEHYPDSRALASGSVRFWYTAWHNMAQLGGGSEQGLLNQNSNLANFLLMVSDAAEPVAPYAMAFGVDAIIVHDEKSKEIYHDFVKPHKFAGLFPVVFNDGEGNFIYKVPRRFPDLARVVEPERILKLPPMRAEGTPEVISAYADAIEKGPDARAVTQWESPDVLRVHATVGPGQGIAVLESYDPYWRAYAGGRVLGIRRDVMGQMLIDAPAGEQDIRLVFELPLENLIGRIITLLSLGVVFGLIVYGRRPVP